MHERLEKLRRVIQGFGADAFYVRDTSNVRWLTGFDGVFDDEQAHALMLTSSDVVLHTDSRYAGACRQAAAGGGIAVNDDRVTHARFAANALVSTDGAELGKADGEGKGGAPAGAAGSNADAESNANAESDGHAAPALVLVIEDAISLAEYRQLETAFGGAAHFLETTDSVLRLRAVKDEDEMRRLRAAQAVTDAAFAHLVEFIRSGMTEREVQVELEDFMRRHGAEDLAFSSIVATGGNGASPHAIPGDTVLEAGQCVVLDFGAKVQGYCSDMTRMVFLGEPNERMRHAYETLRAANEEVERSLRPGVTGKEMHELAERVLADAGFAGKMGHGLGHGVGLDIHELPNLSPRNGERLVAGNVVTVEPGIYLPGEFGMRLEDFGVVTSDGFQVFTQSSHDLVML